MNKKNWEVLSSEHVLKNKFYNVWKDKCKMPNGLVIDEWYYRTNNDFTFICALDNRSKILIEELYRHGAQCISFELPSGTIDKNETAQQNAKRELEEETGYKAKRIKYIKKLGVAPCDSRRYIYLFIATDLRRGAQKPEPGEEDAKIHFYSISKIEQMINKGKIICSQTIAALHIFINYLNTNARNT